VEEVFLPIECYTKHRDPMLVVSALVKMHSKGQIAVKTVLKENGIYFLNGKFSHLWLIEIMAQSITSLLGYQDLKLRKRISGEGIIVKVDSFKLFVPSYFLKVNDEIITEVTLEARFEKINHCFTRATINSSILAEARLTGFEHE